MIKVIANREVDLSNEEWAYYKQIEDTFGKNALMGMFETNKKGEITIVKPSVSTPTSMILIFFLLNLQLNQKLRSLTDGLTNIKDLEDRVKKLESKMKEL